MNDMNAVDIDMLHGRLAATLGDALLQRVEMRVLGPSGLSVKIDGANCLNSIGVWPNGCCDVDFLNVSTEQGKFEHFEFESTEGAFNAVLREIERALARV
jgi:hypothetical protein